MPPPAASRTHRAYVIARRTVLALGLLIVAAIALREEAAVLLYTISWRLDALRPARADWHLLEVEPDTLTIRVHGVDSCVDFDLVDVDERPDEVRIKAYIRRVDGWICTSEAILHQITIPLSAPLADRRLEGCSQSGRRSCWPAATDRRAGGGGP